MADPATMIMAGAALGAATNRDDPLKGAMMGAALGGVGGSIASGAMGGAEAGLLGGESISLARPDVAPVLSDYLTASQAQGLVPMAGDQIAPRVVEQFASPTFDFDAIARASLGSDLPGASAVAGSSPVSAGFNPMQAMMATRMLQPQQQPMPMGGGGIKRGDPRLVQQDPIMSLLAPKRIEKRKISLL
jgi:hypothetical protein